MALFTVAFDDALTDMESVDAIDCWHAAEKAADGLDGRERPAHMSIVWVFDHANHPAVWKSWQCWHRVQVSIGFLGTKEVE